MATYTEDNITSSRPNYSLFNPFTPTRYPTWLKKIQLAFCNPYDVVITILKEYFPYVT